MKVTIRTVEEIHMIGAVSEREEMYKRLTDGGYTFCSQGPPLRDGGPHRNTLRYEVTGIREIQCPST